MNSLAMLRISIAEAATDATTDISAVLLGMIFFFLETIGHGFDQMENGVG